VRTVRAGKAKAGKVVRQSPRAGSRLAKGTKVNIVVGRR
jgi:beta-lactam-binding protein with PASTA domain